MSVLVAVVAVVALVQPGGGHQLADTARPYEDMLCQYRDWDCVKAYRVMLCESSGNPSAYAGGSYGLMQVNGIHAWRVGGDPTVFYDPSTNIDVAHELYQEQGWAPWAYCGRR